jgi:hypothetical protein
VKKTLLKSLTMKSWRWVQEDMKDDLGVTVWEGKEEALKEIDSWWDNNRPAWVPRNPV